MSESVDHCARCGESIPGRPRAFRLPMEWREYLEEERGLGWFPMAPVVVLCHECYGKLDHLSESVSEVRGYGTEEHASELESEMRSELDALDLDRIVDDSEF